MRRAAFILCLTISATAVLVGIMRAPLSLVATPEGAGHRLEALEAALDPVVHTRRLAWSLLSAGEPLRAEIAAREAIAAAPLDAYAILALAWSLHGQGREAEARAMLERTYALAPRSMVLAQSRVALAQAWWPRMSDAERKRLLAEIRIARGVDAHGFNMMAARTPRLAALHRLALAER